MAEEAAAVYVAGALPGTAAAADVAAGVAGLAGESVVAEADPLVAVAAAVGAVVADGAARSPLAD